MIARPQSLLHHDAAFDRELQRFADRLARDAGVSPIAMLSRFPERSEEIRRLVAAAATQASQIPEDWFPPLSETHVAPAPLRLGAFRLASRLGAGGMGEVYRGIPDSRDGEPVAIKIIRPELSSDAILDRFSREREYLSRLCHPHIVSLIGSEATESDPPHLVMELVSGVSVTRYVDRKDDESSLTEWVERLIEVCGAIEHVHQSGLVHRDIKPANILIGEVDGQAFAKLIDFGLAKEMDPRTADDRSRWPHATGVLGTPAYMSPEQMVNCGNRVDGRSDLFSLGAVLFELLTGSTRLDEELADDMPMPQKLERVRRQQPLRPSDRVLDRMRRIGVAERSRLSSRSWVHCQVTRKILDAICVKAMANDPEQRYQAAAALASDLTRFLEIADHIEALPIATRFSKRVEGSDE